MTPRITLAAALGALRRRLAATERYWRWSLTTALAATVAAQLAMLAFEVGKPGGVATTLPLPAPSPAAARAAEPPPVDFGPLVAAHLFGVAPVGETPPAEAETEPVSPATTLDLKLTGLLLSSGAVPSQAIISSRNARERTYVVGDAIDDADGATLHAVHRDRVTLRRGDRLESLSAVDVASAAASPYRAADDAPLPMPEPQPAASANVTDELPAAALPENPLVAGIEHIRPVVRMQPYREGGYFVGVRVTPGIDAKALETLGLKRNDIVTALNGAPLDDEHGLARIVAALASSGYEAPVVRLSVRRDGAPLEVDVNTTPFRYLP